jgi:glycosyltransferase involved in cell wall biosynthesis
MKIIQLIQRPQLRGAEVFACHLSHELNKKGHTAIPITVFDARLNDEVGQGKIPLPYDGEIRSINGSEANRLWDWKAWRKLAEVVVREKPDIVQANAGDTLKYAVLSKLFFHWKAPIVFRNASTINLYIKSRIGKVWNSFLFSFVSYVISVSEFTKNDFLSVFPWFRSRIAAIPIGIVEDPVHEEELKRPDFPTFIHVGGFTFEKNHAGLISIFKKIRIRYPSAVLGLVGDGPLRPAIQELVETNHLSDHVIFYGYQSRPATYLQTASALLLPSIIEGLPSVILEAFYHKLPVVAYNAGGIAEIVKPSLTGFLVEKGDEETFAASACEAVLNTKESIQRSENAFQLVMKEYTMAMVSEGFITAYQTILSDQKKITR